MTSLRTLLGMLLVAALLGVASARPVAADDKSPLDKLTPQEREYLEQKVPDWSELEEHKQQQYAKNLLRLRSLTPEQRAKLAERIGELDERRARGAGPRRGRRPPHDSKAMRRKLEVQGKLMRVIGSELWKGLSEESRAAITRVLGHDGRRHINEWFFRSAFSELAKAKIADGTYADFELTSEVSTHHRKRVEQLRAKAAEGDKGAQTGLAHFAVSYEIAARIQPYVEDGQIDEEGLHREARAFVANHPELFGKLKARLEAAAADPSKLRTLAKPPGRRGPMGDRGRFTRELKELRKAREELRKALEALAPSVENQELKRRVARVLRALERIERYDRAWGAGPGGMRRPGLPGQPGGRRGPGGRPGGGPGHPVPDQPVPDDPPPPRDG